MDCKQRKLAVFKILVAGLAGLLLSPALLWAQDWQEVTDPSDLKSLMSGTTMEATLAKGEKASAKYNADGTGLVQAWGDSFPRKWEVSDEGRMCIDYGDSKACLKIERDAANQGVFRSTNEKTGESQVFSVFAGGQPVALSAPTAESGGAATPSADEIAKSLANPNTPLATMTLKLQYRTFDGDLPGAGSESGTMALFQPAFPFSLDGGRMVFFRPAVPIMFDQPAFDPQNGDFKSVNGLGDIGFDLAYGGATKSGLTWATGVISTLPTATEDELGKDRWTLGPEVLLAKLSAKGVLGALLTYQKDVGGSGDADVSLTTINVFATYLPGGGWNVGSVPIINYDHEASQWTLPLNLQVGKTVIMGGRPWKLGAEINYFVEQPDVFGPQWMLGVSIGPVVKNVMADWFK